MSVKAKNRLRENKEHLPDAVAAAKAAVSQRADTDAPDTGGAASSSVYSPATIRNVQFTKYQPIIADDWEKTLNNENALDYWDAWAALGGKDMKELRALYFNVSGQHAPVKVPKQTLTRWIAHIKVVNNM